MVVTAYHHRADLAVSDQFVELQRDSHPALSILVEYSGLSPDDQLVLLCVPYPDVVVAVLAPSVGVNALHRGLVSFHKVLVLAAQAHPSERTITIVEQLWPHDVFNIGREDEPILLIHAILCNLLDAGIENSLQEAVAIVKEVRPSLHEGLDEAELASQGLVNQLAEPFPVSPQKLCPLLKREALRAVPTVICCMT